MYEVDAKCQKCRYNQTATCNRCDMYYDEFEPIEESHITNADRIRAMTSEELAEWLTKTQRIGDVEVFRDGYYQLWLDWLKEGAVSDG